MVPLRFLDARFLGPFGNRIQHPLRTSRSLNSRSQGQCSASTSRWGRLTFLSSTKTFTLMHRFHWSSQGQKALEDLHRITTPFILRRMKEDVLQDLPPKVIQDYSCTMTPLQVSRNLLYYCLPY